MFGFHESTLYAKSPCIQFGDPPLTFRVPAPIRNSVRRVSEASRSMERISRCVEPVTVRIPQPVRHNGTIDRKTSRFPVTIYQHHSATDAKSQDKYAPKSLLFIGLAGTTLVLLFPSGIVHMTTLAFEG